MQVKGVARDLIPGDPLCAPSSAVLVESLVTMLRSLHRTKGWTSTVNQQLVARLQQVHGPITRLQSQDGHSLLLTCWLDTWNARFGSMIRVATHLGIQGKVRNFFYQKRQGNSWNCFETVLENVDMVCFISIFYQRLRVLSMLLFADKLVSRNSQGKWKLESNGIYTMSDREPTRWQHNRIYPHPINP